MFEHLLWHSPEWIPTAIGTSMLLVAAVFGIYWTQVRALAVPWRWMMPSLRGVALVMLIVSLIQPVIVSPRTSAQRGAIVLLMDKSASMGVIDADRTPSQLVALADGLHALPSGTRPRDAAKLQQAPDTLKALTDQLFLARGQLDYARIASQDLDTPTAKMSQLVRQATALADQLADYPRVARLAQELSILAGQTDLPADQWSRNLSSLSDTLNTAIAQAQTSADNDLYRSNGDVRNVCDQIGSLSRLALVERALTSPASHVLDELMSQAPVFGFSFGDAVTAVPLQRHDCGAVDSMQLHATGAQSDLASAIRSLRESMHGKAVQAVVLFSDGRQVGNDVDLSPILTTTAAPIFTVNSAGPVHRDLAIVRMGCPANVFANESAIVHVEIRSTGFHQSPVNVELKIDNQRQTRQAVVDDSSVTPLDFPLKIEQAGVHDVVVSIPPQLGEATNLNNQLHRSVKVIGQKINVLAIASWPGWDFQLLRQALSASPFVNLQTAIVAGEGNVLSQKPQEILQQDVIILSDVRADALSAEQWQAVHDRVTSRGGSVIVVPGDAKNLAEISQQAHMADLLPMQNPAAAVWRVWPGEQPYFQLIPPPDQMSRTPVQLADDATVSAQMWNQLPGTFRFMPIESAKPQARPLLIERESGLPVLTEMSAGAGRSFFFGSRETWRWRSSSGDAQDRFWTDLIRHAVPPAYAVRQDGIAFDADPIDASPGESIHVRAQIAGSATPVVFVLHGGKITSREPLHPASSRAPGEFETVLHDLPIGDFELSVTTTNAPGAARLPLHIAPALEKELADISGDDTRLARIASATGGQAIALEDIADLPRMIAEAGRKQPGFSEYPLWDSPYLFAFLVGCFGVEWALRKRFGLA